MNHTEACHLTAIVHLVQNYHYIHASHWAPKTVVVLPQFATMNHTVTLSLLPPLQWDGEENQKEKRQKLLSCEENSLTMAKGEENNHQ